MRFGLAKLEEDKELMGALPRSLAQMAAVVPMRALLALADRFGGTRVYVPSPRKLRPTSRLVRAIGLEATEALSKLFSGDTLVVPKADKVLRMLRNRRVIAALRSGKSVSNIARKFALSERMVYNILSAVNSGKRRSK